MKIRDIKEALTIKQKLTHIEVRPNSRTHPDNLGKIGQFGGKDDLSNDDHYAKAVADAHAYGKEKYGDGRYEVSHVDNSRGNSYAIRAGSVLKVRREMRECVELEEARIPLEGHPYHNKSDAELHGIIKDAGETAKIQKGMSSETKYLDQVNDASTILYHRKKMAESVISNIANKIMGASPKSPKYKVGQIVSYSSNTSQPDWEDKGTGKGKIDSYSNGHYMINGNPVNHFEIKKVHEDVELEEGKFSKMIGIAAITGAAMGLAGHDAANADNKKAHDHTQAAYSTAKTQAHPLTDPVKFRKAFEKAKAIKEELSNVQTSGAHKGMDIHVAAAHNAKMHKSGGVEPGHVVMVKGKLGMAFHKHDSLKSAADHANSIRSTLARHDPSAKVSHYSFDESGNKTTHS